MKRKLKRILLCTLAAIVAAAPLAGCGAGEAGQSSAAAPASGDVPASQAESAAEAAGEREIVNIQMYGMDLNPNKTFYQWQQDYFAEQIGVNVEIIPHDKEKLQPMLAAGDLPDIGMYAVDGDPTQAIQGGLVMDLTPYEDRIPNYTRNTASVQFSKDMKSAGTGNLYALLPQIGAYDHFPMDIGTYAANIRWDIYELAGKPEVTDMYTYLDALKQMQEAYPATPDGLPVYAIGLHPEWDGATLSGAGKYMSVNGVMDTNIGYNFYDLINDKIDPVLAVGGGYYEALRWLNTANRMGLLDPDSMTQTYEITQAKTVDSGQYLTSMAGNYFNKFNTTERVNADNPQGFMPLIWDAQRPVVPSDTIFGDTNNLYMISSATKHLDACLDFLNLLYDFDAHMVLYGGPQGELWDVVDGQWVLTDAGKNFVTTGEHTFYTGESSRDWWGRHGYRSATLHPVLNKEARISDTVEFVEEQIANNKVADLYEAHYGFRRPIEVWNSKNLLLPQQEWKTLVEVMPTDLQDIQNNVKGIVVQDSWKIVMNATSDQEVEAMFTEMVNKANAMGAQDIVAWGQEQINNAKTQMAKYQ